MYMSSNGGSEMLANGNTYGETQLTSETTNQRGRISCIFDEAGVVTNRTYDFKGNLLTSRHQLASNSKDPPD
jgi:hypothetical protein